MHFSVLFKQTGKNSGFDCASASKFGFGCARFFPPFFLVGVLAVDVDPPAAASGMGEGAGDAAGVNRPDSSSCCKRN